MPTDNPSFVESPSLPVSSAPANMTPKPTPYPYSSFLVVQNGKVIDIYYNGVHLGSCRYNSGVVPDLVFTPNLVDGQSVDLQRLPHPCPFSNERDFKLHFMRVVDSIHFPEPKLAETPADSKA